MITALSLLMLLDYSGSMEQVVEQKPKVKILKEQISGILETLDQETHNEAFIFGSNPKKGCQDLVNIEGSSKKLKDRLNLINPGAYGKTPLSKGLRTVGKKITQTKATTAVVVTDGGDSCDEDPCQALKDVNISLVKVQKKITLFLISFDMKTSRKELKCVETLNLSNIKINQINALGSLGFNQALKEIQKNILGLPGISGKSSASGETVSPSDINSEKRTEGSFNESLDTVTSSDKNKSLKNISFLEIIGAPIEARFLAESTKGKREWRGNFILQTLPGSYKVKFLDIDGITLSIGLAPEEHKQIPWAKLIKNPISKFKSSGNLIELQLIPSDNTKQIHGMIEPILVKVDLNSLQTPMEIDIPFGQYEVQITNPIWLIDRVTPKVIELKREGGQSVNFLEFFKDQIKVLENTATNDFIVLDLSNKGAKNERYLIQPGHKKIPVPISANASLIEKN